MRGIKEIGDETDQTCMCRRAQLSTLGCLLVLVGAACGGSSAEDEVTLTVREFYGFVMDGNATDACRLVQAELKRAMEKTGMACEAGVRSIAAVVPSDELTRVRAKVDDAEIDVSVVGEHATATLINANGTREGSVELVHSKGSWSISNLTSMTQGSLR